MVKVTKESVLDINFLSNINYAPDGKHAAFVVAMGTLEENNYKSNIYLYTSATQTVKKLTTFDGEKSLTWLDEETLIFPAIRTDKDKERAAQATPVTNYYKINIHGGEAEKFLTLAVKAGSIKPISDTKFLLSVTFDNTDPNFTDKTVEEIEAYYKAKQETIASYHVFDELPFWENGKGITNKLRTRLYIYDFEKTTLTPISDPFMDVVDYSIDDLREKIIFTGSEYTDMLTKQSQICLYDIKTAQTKTIPFDEVFHISFAKIMQENIVFYGIPSRETNSFINSRFYMVPLDGGTPVLFNTDDISVGSTVGSDCKYGGGVSVRLQNDVLYYISTRRYSSYIFTLDKVGAERQVSLSELGSVDCFDIHDNEIIFIGVRNKGLQELYIYNTETKVEKQISNFNGEWLENHDISYPEYFEFTNSSGTSLDGFVIKPVGLANDKKYPAILDIHGGPKATYGDVLLHEMQLWANEGYFVFFTNPRGSNGRGSEFANIEGERYGIWDYDDLMQFTDEVLARYSQIDETRLGVTGGSYGGLMTNWIVGHTDRFKAAATQRSIANYISKCLTTDIGYYHNLSQMDGATPWSNHDVLWNHSPLKYADKCVTPLLFIHSDEDYRCYMGDALQMFTALKMHGVDTKFCLFRGENHELSRSGKPKNRINRLQEITVWLDKYLK